MGVKAAWPVAEQHLHRGGGCAARDRDGGGFAGGGGQPRLPSGVDAGGSKMLLTSNWVWKWRWALNATASELRVSCRHVCNGRVLE